MRLHLLRKLEDAHDDSIWALAWAPGSGNLLATASVDESVKFWEEGAEGLELKHTIGDIAPLGAVSITIDNSGSYAAVNSLDSTINIIKLDDYSKLGGGIRQPPSESWGLAFLPASSAGSGPLLALAGGMSNTVKVFDVLAEKEVQTMTMPAHDQQQQQQEKNKGGEKFTMSIACSADGQRIAAGNMDGTVALFDASSGKLLHTLKDHFKPVRTLTFTPDSKFLITGCDDCHSLIYDAHQGAMVDSLTGHESWVLSVSVSADGGALATGGSDGKVKLWDFNARTCVQTASDHSDQVWGVGFKGDGRRLASVSDDRCVCLYDVS